MSISAYIHIPFCSHKCEFCDFAAFAGLGHLEDEYCSVLQEEIKSRLAESPERPSVLSIFYGGGTPGLIRAHNLAAIHNCLIEEIILEESAEISLETTPHSITAEKAESWLKTGINRLSIGFESLQDNELKAIGRDHTRQQAIDGLDTAVRAGFRNISVDFMYGLPTQSLASWKDTLSQFAELVDRYEQIRHFSAYGLHLAGNSPLFFKFPKESAEYPSDELFEEMYNCLVETAHHCGFSQYEVSNFSKPGFHSRHNMSYWNNSEYLAFGVSAHRYVGGVRSSNWRSLALYMRDPLGSETHELIDRETEVKEAIMLGLRLRDGIDLSHFSQTYGFDIRQKFNKQLDRLQEGGFVEISESRLRITQKGVPVSNSIISELF